VRFGGVVKMFHKRKKGKKEKRKKGKKERRGSFVSGTNCPFFLSFFLFIFYETRTRRWRSSDEAER
jgi:hypothetical protein